MLMQNIAANTLLKRKTGVNTASIFASVNILKSDEYTDDMFAQILTGVLAFFTLIMYVVPVYRTTYRIV